MNSLRTPLFLLLSLGCAHAGPAPASEQELTPIGESGFSLAPGGLLIAEGFSMRLPVGLRLDSQEPGQVSFSHPSLDISISVVLKDLRRTSMLTDEKCAELAQASMARRERAEVLSHRLIHGEGSSTCLYSGRDPGVSIVHAIALFKATRLALVVCGEAIPTTDYCPTILDSVELRESAPALAVR